MELIIACLLAAILVFGFVYMLSVLIICGFKVIDYTCHSERSENIGLSILCIIVLTILILIPTAINKYQSTKDESVKKESNKKELEQSQHITKETIIYKL